MNAIFALFGIVDQDSTLQVYMSYTFKDPFSRGKLVKESWKRVWGSRKAETGETPEAKKSPIHELFCSLSYRIISKDPYLKEQLRQNIKSAYAPFVSNGKLKIKPTEKFQ